ncbi:mucin-5B-like [Leucoraja erinacea]|uniref:mucin-5B-like n=1 Tax=Leucoraja erinaceus TaxID=7782 RepID=UPI002455EB92|nr:mucin-5B-like [Leucoraja erinacea]
MKHPILCLSWLLVLLKDISAQIANSDKEWVSKPNPETALTALLPNWKYRTCTTWGNGAVRRFDDNFYHFTSNCYFVLSSNCQDPSNLNVKILRGKSGHLRHIFIEIESVMIVVNEGNITVKDQHITVPYDDKIISVQQYGTYIKFSNRKQTMFVLWNLKDELSVNLHSRYNAKLCGLCGNFPAGQKFDAVLTVFQYQLSASNDPCETIISEKTKCAKAQDCKKLQNYFQKCTTSDILRKYMQICLKDVCSQEAGQINIVCNTFEETARQCATATYSQWQNWRNDLKCAPPSCPENQVYKEYGSSCIPTCTDPDPQSQCDKCVNTCDCPEGMVLDDIRNTKRCIQKKECPCTCGEKIYLNGELKLDNCQLCTCKSGEWICYKLKCPQICKFEEGNHITTFDQKSYQMMGDCTYVAAVASSWIITVEMHPCQEGHQQICLDSVTFIGNKASLLLLLLYKIASHLH